MKTTTVRAGFTLIELLVVMAIIAILASLLFPVFSQVRAKAKQTSCLSNMRQIGMGMAMYMMDYDERLPDCRDLKNSLPGGYKPWSSWPTSDPRCGWAAIALGPYVKSNRIFLCPELSNTKLGKVVQVQQFTSTAPDAIETNYWMWRFDRPDDPVPLDDLWGKSEDQAVSDLDVAKNPQAGTPQGVADVEMAVDPYFPYTIPSVSAALKGKSVHFGGRNRLFLDWHVKFLKDRRTY